jgi:hypothetical protein
MDSDVKGLQMPKGQICRVCDRKFYIKDLFKASRLITDEQSQEIMNLRRQIYDRERSCKQLESDFQAFTESIDDEKEG